jgi:SAM-dependent methyltransferase
MRDTKAESDVRRFYDAEGWSEDAGITTDAALWEDLRPCARDYVACCRRKVLEHLPASGDRLLDAASGPIQYPEYLEYSAGFTTRVCVDISARALQAARAKLGERGEYHCLSILELPFAADTFDAVVSMHTIYHIDAEQQEAAVRQLLRVARPGAPVVIVYANPGALLTRAGRAAKRILRRRSPPAPLYYFAHPLSWWRRFADVAEVSLFPWRSLAARESRILLHGAWMFALLGMLERRFPRLATAMGTYPLVVLSKR